MRIIKITGLILAGLLAISSSAFAGGFGGHGGGGFGGHGGGGFGGGHFGGGHFGGTHFAGGRFGGHYGWQGGNYGHNYWRGGHWYGGRWYGGGWYPYGWYGLGYPYYDDYGYDAPDAYSGDESAYYDTGANSGTVSAAQRELAKLGYYHGSIDGVIGPETEKAVRWFQSVDKIPVTGQLDDQTLQALQAG
jgi:hypothetical protein